MPATTQTFFLAVPDTAHRRGWAGAALIAVLIGIIGLTGQARQAPDPAVVALLDTASAYQAPKLYRAKPIFLPDFELIGR